MSEPAPLVAGRYERGPVFSGSAGGGVAVGERRGASEPTGRSWLARDTVLQRRVLLKELAAEPERADEALHGARVASRLSHPHLVAVYDVVTDSQPPLLVLELVDGPTLTAQVREQGQLRPHDDAVLGAQLASGLAAVHRAGLVHGGVGPSSVLIGADGAPKLTEPIDHDPTLTGERGRSADVWALGTTLRAVLAGGGRGTELGAVLAAMTAKDPSRRLTADEAHRRLADLADEPEVDPAVGFGLFPWADDVPDETVVIPRSEGGSRRLAQPAAGVAAAAGAAGPAGAVGAAGATGAMGAAAGAGGTGAATGVVAGGGAAASLRPGARPRRRRGAGLLVTGLVGAVVLVAGVAFALTRAADTAIPVEVTTTTTRDTTTTGTPTRTSSTTPSTTVPTPTTTAPVAPPPTTTAPPAPTTTQAPPPTTTSTPRSTSTTPSLTATTTTSSSTSTSSTAVPPSSFTVAPPITTTPTSTSTQPTTTVPTTAPSTPPATSDPTTQPSSGGSSSPTPQTSDR